MRQIRNAKIRSTTLGFEDHGIMSAFIGTISGSSGQSFGGYEMGGEWGMEFIIHVLKTLGVESWEKLNGMYCRVDADHSKIYRIGHIIEDKWFDPVEDLKEFVTPESPSEGLR